MPILARGLRATAASLLSASGQTWCPKAKCMVINIGRPKPIFLAAVAVAALILAACGQDSQPTPSGISVVQPVLGEPVQLAGEGDTALPQPNSQARPSGEHGFSHYFFEAAD